MRSEGRGSVPERLLALPRERAGCEHLASQTPDEMRRVLRRYAGALRYGRYIQEGKIRPQDATDEEDEKSVKRTRLEYPTCAVCHMDLRRPYVCLSCTYFACFFRDPVTDAGAQKADAVDGAEVGTSHIGLHLAEEGHAFGTLRDLCSLRYGAWHAVLLRV